MKRRIKPCNPAMQFDHRPPPRMPSPLPEPIIPQNRAGQSGSCNSIAAREPFSGRTLLGRYRIDEKAVMKDAATIYKAYDTKTGKCVAVKEVGMVQVNNHKAFSMMEREGEMLRGLSHPNIAQLVDFHADKDAGRIYVVTEWVEGKPLSSALGESTSAEDALNIMRRLLDAVQYLHGLPDPVVHRDIKPENVLIRDDGTVVLVDFGFSRHCSSEGRGSTFMAINSLGFTDPEVALGRMPTVRSDIFSLGAVCLYLLCRKNAEDLRRGAVYDLAELPEHLRKWKYRKIHKFFGKTLTMEPEKRYSSAAEMRKALEKCFAAVYRTQKIAQKETALVPVPVSVPASPHSFHGVHLAAVFNDYEAQHGKRDV